MGDAEALKVWLQPSLAAAKCIVCLFGEQREWQTEVDRDK
jgi:hypothetical protein